MKSCVSRTDVLAPIGVEVVDQVAALGRLHVACIDPPKRSVVEGSRERALSSAPFDGYPAEQVLSGQTACMSLRGVHSARG